MDRGKFVTPGLESESLETLSHKLLLATAELQQANDALRAAQRQQLNMLENLSHDLRAPVSAIRGALDLLHAKGELTQEERRSSLMLIDRRTRTLEKLVHDIGLLVNLETDADALHRRAVAVGPFLEEYYYTVLADPRYAEREMTLDLAGSENACASFDIEQIVRVLDNLLTNAWKYSAPGDAICLRAGRTPDGTHVRIAVADTGVGIDAAHLSHIFDRTYTASSARTPQQANGLGLGLAIVKAIVEKHGGSVCCESEKHVGSTFSFTLPLLPGGAASAQ